MQKFSRLIFVDGDDTARTHMARVIMEKKYLLEPMEICSRGLVVLFPEPVNQKAEAVLISNGLTAKEHTAAPLEQEDIDGGTLILTMEEEQKGKIWSTYENAQHVYTLAEYIHMSGDISPLYGEPLTSYGKCYELLAEMIDRLAIRLNEDVLKR